MNAKSRLIISANIFLIFLLLGCTGADKELDRSLSTPAPEEASHVAQDNWIQISSDGTSFSFENKSRYLPHGIALSGAYISYGKDFERLGDFFKKASSNGANYVKIDLEGFSWGDDRQDVVKKIGDGEISFFENPPGNFSKDYETRLTKLFDLAQENGIYIQLAIPSHSCTLADKFDLYPYSSSIGGSSESIRDMRSNPKSVKQFKDRIKELVELVGGRRNLFMWELWNEADLVQCSMSEPAEMEKWVNEMGAYLKSVEMQTYGKNHPVGVSLGNFQPDPGYDFVYGTDSVDVIQTHYYTRQRRRVNPIRQVKEIADVVPNHLGKSNGEKPYLENERLNMAYLRDQGYISEIEHHVMWAYLMSGAAGTGAPWTSIDQEGLPSLDTVQAMDEILAKTSFTGSGRHSGVSAHGGREALIVYNMGDKSSQLGWLLWDDEAAYDVKALKWWLGNEHPLNPNQLILETLFIYRYSDILVKNGYGDELIKFKKGIAKLIADTFNLDREKELEEDPEKTMRQLIQAGSNLPEKAKTQFGAQYVQLVKAGYNNAQNIEENLRLLDKEDVGFEERSAELTIDGLEDVGYTLTFYDDDKGEKISQQDVDGPTVKVKTPAFDRHLAWVLNKKG